MATSIFLRRHLRPLLICQKPFSGHPDPQPQTCCPGSEQPCLLPVALPGAPSLSVLLAATGLDTRWCLGKWPGHSQQVREAPRYNLSWGREVARGPICSARRVGPGPLQLPPLHHPYPRQESPLPVTQPPWEWLEPGATIKPAPTSQGLVTS